MGRGRLIVIVVIIKVLQWLEVLEAIGRLDDGAEIGRDLGEFFRNALRLTLLHNMLGNPVGNAERHFFHLAFSKRGKVQKISSCLSFSSRPLVLRFSRQLAHLISSQQVAKPYEKQEWRR